MEEQEDGWLTVLEKNGLGPAAAILHNYGIDSETDLLVLDPDDFSKLASRGLKPFHVKKLERWCEAVRERAIKSFEERKDSKGKDTFDLCRIGGSQTVQVCQDSRTCCVQF
jgi:hypothetical protein